MNGQHTTCSQLLCSKLNTKNMNMVITRLNHKKLNQYFYLQDSLLKCNVEKNNKYQATFRSYYRMRWPLDGFPKDCPIKLISKTSHKNLYGIFFEILEREKYNNNNILFYSVLEEFYNITGRYEASFCSKLVATINPKLPVWDTNVLKNLGLKRIGYGRKLNIYNNKYLEIKTCIDNTIYKNCSKQWQILFDNNFPKFNGFTDVKKLDLFLWQLP